jgi:hypothetical protein
MGRAPRQGGGHWFERSTPTPRRLGLRAFPLLEPVRERRSREESERELVDSFLDHVAAIDGRVDARVVRLDRVRTPRSHSGGSVLLALGSMGIGIGVTRAASAWITAARSSR